MTLLVAFTTLFSAMRSALLAISCLLAAAAARAEEESPALLGWYAVSMSSVPTALSAVAAARERFEALPLRLVDREELESLLKRHDQQQGLLNEAGQALRDGRELHMGLKLWEAAELYRQAVSRLEQGFVRYYDPGRLAEPLLQLGVALLQAGEEGKARKAFMRAAALAPALELSEGYYGPSVRKAFAEAREELGPLTPGIPDPGELLRMSRAAGLRGLVTISPESLGDRPLLRLALFDAERGGFAGVETTVFEPERAGAAGEEAASRLVKAGIAAGLFPGADLQADAPDAGMEAGNGNGPQALAADAGLPIQTEMPPPPDPWYVKHKWIWVVAAAAIGTAVLLPLTVLRKDVVDVRLVY